MAGTNEAEKYRSRAFMLMLYPDNEAHLEAISKITQSYDYAGCKHDNDTWTEKDEKKNPEHKAGELKKEHIHFVVRFKNDKWNTALCKELGIEDRFVEKVQNFDKAIQYLIHYNDSDKYQYDREEVFGPLKVRLEESLSKIEKSEGEKVVELIQFIRDYDGRLSITAFAEFCARNGYWAEFRRSGAIFVKIIEEKNGERNDRQTC